MSSGCRRLRTGILRRHVFWLMLPCGTLRDRFTHETFHNTHNRILTELMLKFSPAKMEAEKQPDQEEFHTSLLSLSTDMQSLSINMEVDTPTPQEDGGTMFRVTLIRLRWFLPICEFHLKSDDAVDHAYKYIQERFSEDKFYYDQQNGRGGTIVVRARSKKDESVCGVAMVEKVELPKNDFS